MTKLEFAQAFRNYSIALFFGVLSVAVLLVAMDLHRTIPAIPSSTAGVVNTQGAALDKRLASTQADLNDRLTEATRILDNRMASIQKDLNSQLQALGKATNGNIEALRANVDAHLKHVDGLVDQTSTTLGSVHDLAESVHKSVDSYQLQAPELYRRTSLLLARADNLALQTQVALPEFVKSGQETVKNGAGVTADVHTFTTRFVAPTTKKGVAWGVFRVVVNPVAWITTRF